jgi:alpha-tubulin suppressor-like RCC1 family protein
MMVMAKKGVAAVVNGLFAWGSNAQGSLGLGTLISNQSDITRIGTDTDWSSISGSTSTTLAIKNGQLWSWGYNGQGQLGNGTTTISSSPAQVGSDTNWSAVASGNNFSIALKTNGTLWGWGGNRYYQITGAYATENASSPVQIGSGATGDWQSISVGENFAHAIKTNGTLWGWGRNNNHQLGLLNFLSASSPVQIGTATDWATIRGGILHGGAIKTGGSMWSWGSGSDGQTGLLNTLITIKPRRVGLLTNWSKLAIGRGYGRPTCAAIKTDGTLWTWGNNQYYNLGLGDRVWRSSPVQVGTATDWNEIAIGQDHGVAIKATNQLWTFGVGNFGSQGRGNVFNGTVPARVGLLTDWAKTAAGRYCSGAVKTDGTMWTWGNNQSGKLGLGNTTDRSSPVQVGTDTNWSMLSMGINIAAAVKTTGTLWTWGNNGSGELGTSNTVSRSSPAQVGTDTNWSVVRVGHGHMAGLKTDGTLWMWGSGAGGRLGQGNTTSRSSPVQVGTNTDWAEVYCGTEFTVARKTDGTVWAWGSNGSSRLGNSENIFISPTQVGTATNWSKVSGMSLSAIGRTTTGQLWAWGSNLRGQLGLGDLILRSSPIQIGSATDWADVTTGIYLAVARKNNGTLWGWGRSTNNELINPILGYFSSPVQIGSDSNWTTASAGSRHIIALKTAGSLWGWGRNVNSQLTSVGTIPLVYSSPVQVETATNWSTIATGSSNATHIFVLKTDGSLHGMGPNSQNIGQLGQISHVNTPSTVVAPLQLNTSTDWSKAIVGYRFSVARRTTGTLWGWGYNLQGQLGLRDVTSRSSPVQIGTDTNWSSQISSGDSFCHAIRTTGTLWAWGNGTNGRLGLGDVTNRSSPVQVGAATDWSTVFAGRYSAFAIKTTGTLWGWGTNSLSQLGLGDVTNRSTPVQVGTDTNWSMVAAGRRTTLAIKTTGSLWAWGSNTYGLLAQSQDENFTAGTSPRQIGTATDWSVNSTGYASSFAIKTNGTLWAWGAGSFGRLGLSDLVNRYSPVQVGTDTNWSKVEGGGSHTGAIKTTGTLWTWGSGVRGALGGGNTTQRTSPVQVGANTDWSMVNCSGNATAVSFQNSNGTFAIKTNGTLWAWGNGVNGRLGLGDISDRSSPVQVGTATDWAIVKGGAYAISTVFTLAIKTTGSLWAWGNNNNGQLGLGDFNNRSTPVQVGTATNWSKVTTGGRNLPFALAIKTDGTLWAWGSNSFGMLGLGDTTSRSSPVQVGTDTDWADVTATAYATIARKTNGSLWTWGSNRGSALGCLAEPETILTRSSPAQVGTSTDWAYFAGESASHIIARKTDGTLWSWGIRSSGQGGVPILIRASVPVQIGTGTNWSFVSVSDTHALALKTDGTLWAWGRNYEGQLGINSIEGRTLGLMSPVQVGTDTNWSNCKAGGDGPSTTTSIAIKTNGTLWGWGQKANGTIGLGLRYVKSPVQLGSATNWDTLMTNSFGTYNSFAISNP